MKNFFAIFSLLLTGILLPASAQAADDADPVAYVKVKDASVLTAGDTVVIVCETKSVAMSTTQNSQNRGSVDVTFSGDTVKIGSTVEKCVLEAADDNTWYLRAVTKAGYLYATNSTARLLTSDEKKYAFSISITEDYDAEIIYQGSSSTYNQLQNSTNAVFVCLNKKATAVQLYRSTKVSEATPDVPEPTDPTTTITFAKVFDASTLAAGDTILFVNEANAVAMSTTQTSTGRSAAAITVDATNSTVQVGEDAQQLVLRKNKGYWYFEAVGGDNAGFLYMSSDGKSLLTSTKNSQGRTSGKATIEIADGNAEVTICATGHSDIPIKYRPASELFSVYTTECEDIQIYRRTLVKETSISVTISSLAYATLYYSSYALEVPSDDLVAWAGKEGDGQFQKTKEYGKGEVIPAGTAVVLYGTPGTYTFNVVDKDGTLPDENMLFGSDNDGQDAAGPDENATYLFYKLSYDDDQNVGFYWDAGTSGKTLKTTSHKAYLAVPQDDTNVQAIGFGNVATGLGNLKISPAGQDIRDVQGRKLQRLQSGVNIVDGRKILMK